jgi:OmpA-OmpF porin, OOP family
MKRYPSVGGAATLLLGVVALSNVAVAADEAAQVPEGYLGTQRSQIVTDSGGDCVRTSTWTEAVDCREKVQVAKVEPPPAPKRFTFSGTTLFDFDKATLRPEGKRAIDEAVDEIRGELRTAAVEDRRITVTGHTDSVGSDTYNQLLSERRAEAVQDYLITRGIDPDIIEAQGMGEGEPIASNDAEEGRQENRRVEVTFEAVVEPKR